MWAAQEGRTEIAKHLLERGAKVDDPDEVKQVLYVLLYIMWSDTLLL